MRRGRHRVRRRRRLLGVALTPYRLADLLAWRYPVMVLLSAVVPAFPPAAAAWPVPTARTVLASRRHAQAQ
ncbi:hypothetical protein [Isoptericola sp. NPDC060257]|uniref:hypothetical protein n=1 Tax=Isoptericola sp. NPDC060257 TaxID=3347087 RepID=UPI003653ED01